MSGRHRRRRATAAIITAAAAAVSAASSEHAVAAGFDGTTLGGYLYYPNLSTIAGGPAGATQGAGAEFVFVGLGDGNSVIVDVGTSSIVSTFGYSGTYSPATFNGWRVQDSGVNDVPAITNVALNPATNMTGLTASRITFDADNIYLNWQGLSFNTSTMVRLDVSFAPDKWYVGPASGAGAVFSDTNNWSVASGGAGGAGVPGGSDTIRIQNNDATNRNVLLNTNITTTGGSTNALALGNTGGGTNTVTQNNATNYTLSVGWENIGTGVNGKGVYTQFTGTNHADSFISLGTHAGSVGTYNLGGGNVTIGGGGGVNGFFIGEAGTGEFYQTAGSVTSAYSTYLGYAAGTSGTYVIGGGPGVLNVNGASNRLSVGFNGAGSLFVGAGGTVNTANYFIMGDESGSTGTASVGGAGATVTAAGQTIVGDSGGGTLDIGSGGVVHSNGGVLISTDSAGTGTGTANVNSGGTWNATSAYIGGSTSATGRQGVLNINTGGTMTVTGAMKVWDSGAYPGGTTLRLAGGTLSAGTLNGNSNRFKFESGTLNLTGAGTSTLSELHIGTAGNAAVNQAAGAVVTNSMYLGETIGAGAAYSLSAGSLTTNHSWVGYYGSGTFVQTGGTHTNLDMTLGIFGTSASYSLGGTGVLTTTNYTLILEGDSFNQSGGTHTTPFLEMVGGVYQLSGGTLSVAGTGESEWIGYGGNSTFTHTAGTHTNAGSLLLGANEYGNAHYSLSGTGSLSVAGTESIGHIGDGTFTQSGGTNSAGTLYVGRNSGSTGQYTLQGGTLTINSSLVVGAAGSASFIQTGGVNQGADYTGVASGTGSTGTYSLSGGSHSAGFLVVGQGGDGTYSLSGTGVLTTGVVDVSASTFAATAAFIQSGGTHNAQLLIIGAQSLSTNSSYALSGTGQLTVGDSVYVGGTDTTALGTGTLSISGGTATVTSALKVWNTGAAAPNGSRINLTGGTLSIGSLNTDGNPARFNWTGGTLTLTASHCIIDATGPLGSSLTIDSAKTLIVSGVNSLQVGGTSTGTLNQTGGSVTAYTTYVAVAGGSGTYNLDAGALNTNILNVGYVGIGNFDQDGGTVTVSGETTLGYVGSGTYNLAAGALNTQNVAIGLDGVGVFNQTGGTHTASGAISLGAGEGSGGSYFISNNAILSAAELTVGAGVDGAFTQSGTSSVTAASGLGLRLGASAGATGTATLNGGTFTASAASIGGTAVAAGGTGLLNINTGATMTVNGTFKLWNTGVAAPGGTRVNFAGGTLTVASINTDSNAARFNWTGGTLNVNGAGGLNVSPAGGIASVSVPAAGTLNVTNALSVGSGGTLTVAGAMSAASLSVASGGTLNFAHSGAFTWPGVITGAGTINKTGAGVLTLPVDWTHTGNTNLNAGTIRLTGTGGVGNQTRLNIASGATYDQNGHGDVLEVIEGSGSIINVGTLFLGASGSSGTFSGTISGAGRLQKTGGGTQTLTGVSTYTGGTILNLGTLVVNRLHENNPVTITAGTLKIAESSPTIASGHPGGNNAFVSRPGSTITIANNGGDIVSLNPATLTPRIYNGKLDLTNNDLVIDYSATSPIADIEDMIRAGRNGGNWLGNGITSSTAGSIAAAGAYTLGVIDNATPGITPFTTFSGQTVDTTTVLVKFVHRSDINMDGVVTFSDSVRFNGNYSEGTPTRWVFGDLNYNGVSDFGDSVLFNGGYDEALASLPEPGSLSLLGLAALGVARRRRQRA